MSDFDLTNTVRTVMALNHTNPEQPFVKASDVIDQTNHIACNHAGWLPQSGIGKALRTGMSRRVQSFIRNSRLESEENTLGLDVQAYYVVRAVHDSVTGEWRAPLKGEKAEYYQVYIGNMTPYQLDWVIKEKERQVDADTVSVSRDKEALRVIESHALNGSERISDILKRNAVDE